MPKFAAKLAFLFTELAFLDRFKAARDAGLHAVEFMFPYDYKKEELVKRLHDNELDSAANTSRQKTPSQALAGSRGTNK